MLDESQLPLDSSSIINPFLEDIGNDIFEKDKIEVFLQKFVQCLDSEGQYSEDLSCKNIPTKAPIITYSPALILRKRSSALLTSTLEHMRGNLLQQEDLPSGFKDLCEFTDGQNEGEVRDSVDKSYHNDMIFFPKPSNSEQKKIAQKLAYGKTVVIQGPPGTGKSHTIANLICHLLARGKRILITAKTQRAPNVLGNLLPQELRSLCVNLLGSGPEEQRILKSNVGYIIRKHDDWDEESECLEKDKKTKLLAELKEEKVKLFGKFMMPENPKQKSLT